MGFSSPCARPPEKWGVSTELRRLVFVCGACALMQPEEGRAIHKELLTKMIEAHPTYRIPDRNHVSMCGAICVNLARESKVRASV